ncbi:CLUMA_CG005183, isoform A [Clunio marinus]|uniref:CLUMA_CG005183, isoform A n=1 Tax=Clunio marinus TaxID=568069 RepID=A0A1J1HVE1_9DIPT|nr:CLUMA_CG005183, isoform A [Clunio marinus]
MLINFDCYHFSTVPLYHTEAVVGSEARLPCNLTSPITGDRVSLVIWYKEGQSTPIYSFDVRHTEQLDKGSHHEGNGSLNGRSHFNTTLLPSFVITNVKDRDNGLYRCRADFIKSPTRNIKIQLSVIVPPENVHILNEKGVHIPHYILGPYNEGTSINITCVSTGGRPMPKVTWWHDNILLNSTSIAFTDTKVKNTLQLNRLERKDLHNSYVCQSSNNEVSPPITTSVTLDLNLRPLTIKLDQDVKYLSANHSYDLKCEVTGSRPAPLISWWKGSTQLRTTREWTSSDGNLTRSILTYHPTLEDQGKFLSCRAEQTLIPESGIEQGFKLDIHHIPVVSLEFGTNQQSQSSGIREGADVYFECNIRANPAMYKVTWKHNSIKFYVFTQNKDLSNTFNDGIIISNQSFVITNVKRSQMGQYTCIATNSEGEGESNQALLEIQFMPICRPGQVQTYNVGRGETALIQCEVEGIPRDINFVWKFNTSVSEVLDMPSSIVRNNNTKSTIHFKPMTEHDYGTLLCWGSNEMGMQAEPCVFNIIPAGKPDSLSNCSILNQTFDMFQVACMEGFDGGLPQEFVAEVYLMGHKNLFAYVNSKTPFFELKGLEPGMGYDVLVMALNKKGKSSPVLLQGYTVKSPEKQTVVFPFSDFSPAFAPTFLQIKPFLGTLLGIFGALLLILSAIILVVRLKTSSRRDRTRASQISNTITMSSTLSPSLQNGVLLREASADSIDKNPDIIPQESDNEWMNNKYAATTVMAEQQNNFDMRNYDCDRTLFSQHDNNCLQHHVYQERQTFIPVHNEVPTSSLGYIDNRITVNNELTYADLTILQKPPTLFSSATLGRPRHTEIKRVMEPSIYAQIDLARSTPPPLSIAQQVYPTNMIFSTSRNTMPISHPSQIDRLPPPPLFQSEIPSDTQKSILQTVPEAENERPEVPPRNSNTRF